jgi:cytochrome P450
MTPPSGADGAGLGGSSPDDGGAVVFDPDGFFDPGVLAAPQPFYRAAQRHGAVVAGRFGPQVVGRSACEYVLQHPDAFSSAMEAVDLGQSVPLIPLQVDPPDHVTFRRLLDPIFAPKQMRLLEPAIARMVDERIDTFIGRGCCDLAAELAVPLPSSVFLLLLGFPLEQLDMFLEMKDGILRPQGGSVEEMRENQGRAARRIETYFAEALQDRRRRRPDGDAGGTAASASGERGRAPHGVDGDPMPAGAGDLLGRLLAAEVDGQRLTDDQILGICFLFILAGLDTVTDSLECMFAYLAQHPEHRRQIVEDPAIIPSAVEELLRWESPVTTVPRMATRDIEVEGCPVHAGDHVGVTIGAANVDETAVPDACTVDLRRSPNKHLAFGAGIHRCLGSHLARVELRVTLEAWHRRIPEYALAEGATLTYGYGLRQIDELPLVFPPG